MNILHTVEYYPPSVGGAQEVVKQISERLVRRGHRVTVATTKLPSRVTGTINGVRVEEFEIAGNAVHGIRGEAPRYQQFLLDGSFDVMMNYAAQQWATDLAFPVVHRLRYPKILAPCGFSGLFNPQYAAYFRQLPGVLAQYDQLVLHGLRYRDAEFVRAGGLSNARLIPNGASEEEFSRPDPSFRRRYGIPDDVPLILTVGSHAGTKGHRASIEGFRRARIGKAVLLVIGNVFGLGGCLPDCRVRAWRANVLSAGRKRVLLRDPPRADVVAAFHAADLFVFPSALECSPIVLFEAMASRTAFVTSACGNAEEIVEWSRGGVVLPATRHPDGTVATEVAALARAIEDLVASPAERSRLAENGWQAWRERFTWEHIALQYEQAYAEAGDAVMRATETLPEGSRRIDG